MLRIKINLHGGKMPVKHGELIDLYTAEEVDLNPFEYKAISLGVSMELPEGYYGELLPRSSTYKNYKVIPTCTGQIEHTYCGDGDIWHFPVIAIEKTHIPAGQRLCQFRIMKQMEPIEFVAVEELGNPDRGGFGHTGVE